MARVKMIQSKLGSPNGWQVAFYEGGQEYDMPDTLAKIFVEQDKVAEYTSAEGDTGEKAIEAAPKNKAEKVAKNKAE